MACENLSDYYLIIINFQSIFSYRGTRARNVGPNRSILLAGHAPKVGHNGLDCLIELKHYGYVRLRGALRRTNF